MKSAVEQSKNYRLGFMAVVIAAIVTYFIVQVLGPLGIQYSFYNSWSSIEGPPSGTARILGATGGIQTQELLIEAHNGQLFSASICGVTSQPCDPPKWKLISKVPNESIPITRGEDCKRLGELRLNPRGHLVECIYYSFDLTSDDIKNETYVALLTDGSLEYFAMDNFSSSGRVAVGFILITPLLYFTILFLVFRLANYTVRQIRTKKTPCR